MDAAITGGQQGIVIIARSAIARRRNGQAISGVVGDMERRLNPVTRQGKTGDRTAIGTPSAGRLRRCVPATLHLAFRAVRRRWPCGGRGVLQDRHVRSEEHTSELQSLMRHSYAVFSLKKKTTE